MSRLPIKLRVTLAFAAVMAGVFVAVGLFLYLQLGDRLDESIDNGLRSRAGDAVALVRGSGGGIQRGARESLIESDESFAQVLTSEGEVLDSTPQLQGEAVLSPAEAQQGAGGAAFFEHPPPPGVEGPVRLLATGGPSALLLASLVGYAALAVALRPVEAMRRRAADISAAEPDERLPVP